MHSLHSPVELADFCSSFQRKDYCDKEQGWYDIWKASWEKSSKVDSTEKSFWTWDNLSSSTPVLFHCYQWQVLQTARLLSIQIYQWLSLSGETVLSLLGLTRGKVIQRKPSRIISCWPPSHLWWVRMPERIKRSRWAEKAAARSLLSNFFRRAGTCIIPLLPSSFCGKGVRLVGCRQFEASLVVWGLCSRWWGWRCLGCSTGFLWEFVQGTLPCLMHSSLSLSFPTRQFVRAAFVLPLLGLIKSTHTSKSAETRGVLLSQVSVAFCVSRAHNTAGAFM